MTVVEIEHNGVARCLHPAMLRLDVRGADHSGVPLQNFSTFASLMISITVGEARSGVE
jgi:hypothetical protein